MRNLVRVSPPPDEVVTLVVPGMVCEGCADTVRAALVALPGVRRVRVSRWRKQVVMNVDRGVFAPHAIFDALRAKGFETST